MEVDKHLPKIIASQIVTDIINNVLESGEKVIEERYANSFGTSRGPVREALYILENEGMIERIPKRGSFVKKYNKQDLCDLFEVRGSLENMSLSRLKYPLQEDPVNEIDQIISDMATANMEVYAQLNNDFHYKVLSLSGNEVFKNIFSRLGTPLITLQKIVLETPESVKQSYEEHKMLWNAIKVGKINLAKAVLEDHIESGKRRFYEAVEKNKK
ncbi:GntR family transcriptional regulator [Peribacillus sp. TH14]|uniref:GntR family transcriptional regulator n=1 Tax=Peribacillus sp. TH14 TaxID=2798481 RepID=UPI001912D75B|nr:GntR family transcriptional regulator [Peribacillus sp. TH14]MBK5502361.1 GntR family transcriptional regulator [Peribacillus sp. TH14]